MVLGSNTSETGDTLLYPAFISSSGTTLAEPTVTSVPILPCLPDSHYRETLFLTVSLLFSLFEACQCGPASSVTPALPAQSLVRTTSPRPNPQHPPLPTDLRRTQLGSLPSPPLRSWAVRLPPGFDSAHLGTLKPHPSTLPLRRDMHYIPAVGDSRPLPPLPYAYSELIHPAGIPMEAFRSHVAPALVLIVVPLAITPQISHRHCA